MTDDRNPFTTAGIAVMLAVVPLVYTTGIYDYTLLPKRLAFYALFAVIVLGRLLVNGGGRLTVTRPLGLLSIFCLLAGLSFFNTTHPLIGLVELCFQVCLAGLFLFGADADVREARVWTWTLVATGAAVSILGILQYFDLAFGWIPSNGHPSATFGYRNFAALFLVVAIPSAGIGFLYARSRVIAVLSVCAAVLATLFLLYTRTRGAWLGTAVGAAAALALTAIVPAGRRQAAESVMSLGWTRPLLAGLAVVVLAFAGPLAPRFSDAGLQRFDEKKADLASTVSSALSGSGDRGRTLMWSRTLPLIWDHLLTGTGPGHWEYAYPRYDRGAMIRSDSAPKRPHNDLLWIAAEHGVPALGVYVAFLGLCLLAAVRTLRDGEDEDRPYALLSVAVIVGVTVHGCFSFPKEQPHTIAVFYLFAGIACRGLKGRSLPASPLLAALLLVSVAGGLTTWRHIQFDRHYLAALVAEDDNRWTEVRSQAERALDNGAYRPHAYVILGRAHEQTGNLDGAERAYRAALDRFPDSWHAHNGLGIVGKRRGQHEQAMVHYERALDIYPKAASVRTNLGALYRAMGNDDRAEGQFREVLELDPDNLGANNNLGNVLKAKGQLDSAEVYYRRALDADPEFPQANANLGDLLMQKHRYGEAVQAYERAVLASPSAPIYWRLGSAYEAVARVPDAEASYRKAMEIDPTFPRSYFSLATMLYGLHRWQETIDLFEKFKLLWRGDPKFVTFADGRIKASREWLERMEKK